MIMMRSTLTKYEYLIYIETDRHMTHQPAGSNWTRWHHWIHTYITHIQIHPKLCGGITLSLSFPFSWFVTSCLFFAKKPYHIFTIVFKKIIQFNPSIHPIYCSISFIGPFVSVIFFCLFLPHTPHKQNIWFDDNIYLAPFIDLFFLYIISLFIVIITVVSIKMLWPVSSTVTKNDNSNKRNCHGYYMVDEYYGFYSEWQRILLSLFLSLSLKIIMENEWLKKKLKE